jgi:hypothetical protein
MKQRTLLVIVLLTLVVLYYVNVESFSTQDPVLDQLKTQLAELHPRFKHVELYVGDKSYTINKRKVFICLKDERGRYYSRNMLCYVILHEYAHMICTELGHTDKFRKVFDDLLQRATARGLYNPNIPPVSNYCGHD